MAGAIAFSFLLSLFPFCIFLGALAGTIGGRDLAAYAVGQLFDVVPEPVAKALAPEVERVMGQSQYGLLTLGAAVSLFFATSAIESLRAALNVAYRVREGRSYFWCIAQSSLFVFATAAGMLVMAWGVVVGPALAANSQFSGAALAARSRAVLAADPLHHRAGGDVGAAARPTICGWRPAGAASGRSGRVCWSVSGFGLLAAWLYSSWLAVSDYTKFYAGLTQLLSALIFFQVSGMIMILGAEFNRALAEAKSAA